MCSAPSSVLGSDWVKVGHAATRASKGIATMAQSNESLYHLAALRA